jgi:Na+-driven multidrug efflux pump
VDSLAVAFLQSLGLAASMYAAQNLGGRRPDRIRRGVVQATGMAIVASLALGGLLIAFGTQMVRVFIGSGSDEVVHLAHLMLIVNGVSYSALGVLFVLRGALQGIGHTFIPTLTGVIELVMRVGAAILLGAVMGYAGVVLSNPLAWLGAAAVLIPAYVREHRRLAKMPIAPELATETTPIAVIGPTDGSMVVDAVITQPVPVITAPRRRRPRKKVGAGR